MSYYPGGMAYYSAGMSYLSAGMDYYFAGMGFLQITLTVNCNHVKSKLLW